MDSVDFVLFNEGVYALRDLLKTNLSDYLNKVDGIGYKEDTLSALRKAGYKEIKIPEHKIFALQDD